MIAVVAHSPGFGAAYNIVVALRQHWQEATLVCYEKDGYREWEPDIALRAMGAEAAMAVLAETIEHADMTLAIGETGLRLLLSIENVDWLRTKRIAAFMVDTAYARNPRAANAIIRELGVTAVFALPNLIPCAPSWAVPMWMPIAMPENIHKAERVTIVHSPGTLKKRAQKGSDLIERMIDRLRDDGAAFDYETLMGLPQAEVMRRKARAHVVIDQVARQDCEHGLGLSGLEGLACGAVTLSAMPYEGNTAGFIPSPPVIPVYSEIRLLDELSQLMEQSSTDWANEARRAREWAEQHVAFAPWVEYLRRYLPIGWGDGA